MSRLRLLSQVLEIKEYTKEDLYDLLYNLCDCDFTGDNGEEYYKMSKDMCDLEYCIQEGLEKKQSLKDLVKSVLSANYAEDPYYTNHEIDLIERDNLLIVSVATVS